MDQRSYHQRAGIAPDPPLDQRVKTLERLYADLAAGIRAWVEVHNKEQKRWRETHAADTDAMQDHIYALDQKVRNLE